MNEMTTINKIKELKDGEYPPNITITQFCKVMEAQNREQDTKNDESFFSNLIERAEMKRKSDENNLYERHSRGWNLKQQG